jgi:hypothetical protein
LEYLAFGATITLTPDFQSILNFFNYTLAESVRNLPLPPLTPSEVKNLLNQLADSIYSSDKGKPTRPEKSLKELSAKLHVVSTVQKIQPIGQPPNNSTLKIANYMTLLSCDFFDFNEDVVADAINYSIEKHVYDGLVPIKEYYVRSRYNRWGGDRRLFSSVGYAGWQYEGIQFYAPQHQFIDTAIPIWRQHEDMPEGKGNNYRFSLSGKAEGPWTGKELAFYGFNANFSDKSIETLPLYEYQTVLEDPDPDFIATFYYYSLRKEEKIAEFRFKGVYCLILKTQLNEKIAAS